MKSGSSLNALTNPCPIKSKVPPIPTLPAICNTPSAKLCSPVETASDISSAIRCRFCISSPKRSVKDSFSSCVSG